MRRTRVQFALLPLALLATAVTLAAYSFNYVVPSAGGCPVRSRFSTSSPIPIEWSTSLPASPQTVFTSAANDTAAQAAEIGGAIAAALGAWTGVAGTTLNASAFPSALGPLEETATQNACGSDQAASITGQNAICFNQASAAFTPGVISFTRVFVAVAPGQTIGPVTSTFAGQILQADILLRNDGQVTFATPSALDAQPTAYDLESILLHELGHFFGLEHSPLWRAALSPMAPPPGTFWGPRPAPAAPDAPLRDDDRAGLRALYPDPNDTTDAGAITGRVLPANPLALAALPPTASGQYVTGIFGADVVAVDAGTGQVVASAISGWSCPSPTAAPVFDGSYTIERLPLGRTFNLYIEPLDGAIVPSDIYDGGPSVCSVSDSTPCTAPAATADFVAHVKSGG